MICYEIIRNRQIKYRKRKNTASAIERTNDNKKKRITEETITYQIKKKWKKETKQRQLILWSRTKRPVRLASQHLAYIYIKHCTSTENILWGGLGTRFHHGPLHTLTRTKYRGVFSFALIFIVVSIYTCSPDYMLARATLLDGHELQDASMECVN